MGRCGCGGVAICWRKSKAGQPEEPSFSGGGPREARQPGGRIKASTCLQGWPSGCDNRQLVLGRARQARRSQRFVPSAGPAARRSSAPDAARARHRDIQRLPLFLFTPLHSWRNARWKRSSLSLPLASCASATQAIMPRRPRRTPVSTLVYGCHEDYGELRPLPGAPSLHRVGGVFGGRRVRADFPPHQGQLTTPSSDMRAARRGLAPNLSDSRVRRAIVVAKAAGGQKAYSRRCAIRADGRRNGEPRWSRCRRSRVGLRAPPRYRRSF